MTSKEHAHAGLEAQPSRENPSYCALSRRAGGAVASWRGREPAGTRVAAAMGRVNRNGFCLTDFDPIDFAIGYEKVGSNG